MTVYQDIREVVFTQGDIRAAVARLGIQISRDYQDRDLVLVSVLRGGAFFVTDLARAIPAYLSLDFMAISRYGPRARGEKGVRILKDLDEDILGKDVILVEDIIDTGLTCAYLVRILNERSPRSLKVCCLLDRRERRLVNLPLAYVGFKVSDAFLVGYGLDYREMYRNLPFIGLLTDGARERLSPSSTTPTGQGSR
ncbi:MAG: hypoxanthine phosphoribosyltransferase [Bacillota bacterium]|jgi:hypoxanthine phosphoribosyltransferase